MKLVILSISMLLLQCQFVQSSPSSSNEDDGGDFRSLLQKGKDVLVEGQVIKDDLDFTAYGTSYQIAPATNRVNIVSAITFNKCRFKGKLIAYKSEVGGKVTATSFAKNITFVECTFEDEVVFRGTTAQEQVSFAKSIFLKKANFEELDCNTYAVFSECRFSSDVRFQNAYFRKKSDFLKSEFAESVNFQGAYFMLDAQFSTVKSFKRADFSLAQFYGHVFFNYAEWNGNVSFEDTWFKGRAEFVHTKFVSATMKNAWFFGKPRFEQAIVDISIELSGVHWQGGKPDWGNVDKGKLLNLGEE
jgi:uncharacterized protein YjbI with pentapeptide repeats